MPIRRGSRSSSYSYRRPYGSDWLDSNFDLLPDQEWVAADDNGFVASDPDHDRLISKILDKHKKPEEVVITFIDKGAF